MKMIRSQSGKQSLCQASTREGGFSFLEVIIVVAVIIVVVAMAVVGLSRARASARFTGSTREMAGNLERARVDSMRRRAEGAERASVRIIDANSYEVKMDFNGDGVLETRIVTLPRGVKFNIVAGTTPVAIAFDKRGRVANTSGAPTLQGYGQDDIAINVSGAGDIAINGDFDVIVSATPHTDPNFDVDKRALGNANADPTPTALPTPAPTATPDPSPTPKPICGKGEKPASGICQCAPGKKTDPKGFCMK